MATNDVILAQFGEDTKLWYPSQKREASPAEVLSNKVVRYSIRDAMRRKRCSRDNDRILYSLFTHSRVSLSLITHYSLLLSLVDSLIL
jgi:hypothetical protein